MPSPDYEEFIAALNAHGVRYLVIGAHAVAFHARPRATKDLDVLLEPTAANARRALAALRAFFGGADLGYTVEDLLDPQWIVQLGVAPVRIDLLSEIPGFPSFEAAWQNRVDAQFGRSVFIILGSTICSGPRKQREDPRTVLTCGFCNEPRGRLS